MWSILQCSEPQPAETAAGSTSISGTIVVLHGWWEPELHRINQINIVTAAEDEWAGNLKMKGTHSEFKWKLIHNPCIIRDKKCSTEKGVTWGGRWAGKTLVFGDQLKECEPKETKVNNWKRFCHDTIWEKCLLLCLSRLKSLVFLNLGVVHWKVRDWVGEREFKDVSREWESLSRTRLELGKPWSHVSTAFPFCSGRNEKMSWISTVGVRYWK